MIWFDAALLQSRSVPIGIWVARRAVFLAQPKGTSNDLRLRRALHAPHVLFSQRARIGITERGGMFLRFGHGVENGPKLTLWLA
ncbi:MAG TPA: hypothetical protein VKX28_11695 [Xanthobacteraceae bacterium]|nr:hypothetical protein [Xanthobacteraceae bacterium]